jgi:hypothetical protein
MRYLNFLFSFVLIAAISSCASSDVTLIDPSKEYSPTKNVKLLFEEPTREYEVIAIIEGNGTQYNNESQVLKSVRKQAMKIGAHAIFPMSTEKTYVPPTTHANPVQGSPPITIAGGNKITTKVAAIRFIDQK